MHIWREAEGDVTLALARVEDLCPKGAEERLLPGICPARREELRRIGHPGARRESLAASLLLQSLCPDSDPPSWSWRRGSRGKPEIPELWPRQFSLSHQAGFAACALGEVPVGVDILAIGEPRESVARRFLTPREREILTRASDPARCFAGLWTAREALVKWEGTGLTLDMSPYRWEPRETETPCPVYREGVPVARMLLREAEGLMLALVYG